MEPLPEPIAEAVAAAAGPVRRVERLGGSFGSALARVTAGGARFALKWSVSPLPGALAAEAHGLRALAAAQAVRVPAVVAIADPSDSGGQGPAYLLSEWIEGDGARPDMAALGEGLAALHRATAGAFGLERDNYIGGTPQANGWLPAWPAFFRERRLAPQVAMAEAGGRLTPARRRALERVLARLDELLAGAGAAPSLIHGDLWGGNVVAGAGGAPALIDPASSYSDREAELAFTELFGGFGPRFYQAYNAAWPLEPGYAARRDLYNLYHLLNHLNLFGEGYGAQVDAVARRYAG
jgi:fructosamine-3-kinase